MKREPKLKPLIEKFILKDNDELQIQITGSCSDADKLLLTRAILEVAQSFGFKLVNVRMKYLDHEIFFPLIEGKPCTEINSE